MIPEIPGILIENQNTKRKLHDDLNQVLRSQLPQRKFPGAQPVSFERKHIGDLLNENYFVSEKADGVRVLLFTRVVSNKEESYLIDRKNNYYFLPVGLPLPGHKYFNVTGNRITTLYLMANWYLKNDPTLTLCFLCCLTPWLSMANH